MGAGQKQHAVILGARILTAFVTAIITIILVAYYILSQNFHSLLTDYTMKLMASMVSQGVETVEYELQSGREQAAALARSFQAPSPGEEAVFPEMMPGHNNLRMVYVTEAGTISSDKRSLDLRGRQDIIEGFRGEAAVYGPYFNEEGEFVVCYSEPVIKDGAVAGVFSVEKDGYYFSHLIKSIRFINSGESYIINAEGTDIAVSEESHMEWVNSEYNARRLLEIEEDPVTRSVLELERKGLNGETGVGTYEWDDGLCYLVYEPIPSMGWVLLCGLREEEIASMTQSALFTSLSKGPVLSICLGIFILLTVLIIYWIAASTKKNAQINEKLELIANHDPLTGLCNRNFLESSLIKQWKYPVRITSQAAVFMLDIDDFKKYNDTLGHPQGDECLKAVAGIFSHAFDSFDASVIRYGGEEFVAVAFLMEQEEAISLGNQICRLLEERAMPDGRGGVVTVSIGICYTKTTLDRPLWDCIQMADKALYEAKHKGKNQAMLLHYQMEHEQKLPGTH